MLAALIGAAFLIRKIFPQSGKWASIIPRFHHIFLKPEVLFLLW